MLFVEKWSGLFLTPLLPVPSLTCSPPWEHIRGFPRGRPGTGSGSKEAAGNSGLSPEVTTGPGFTPDLLTLQITQDCLSKALGCPLLCYITVQSSLQFLKCRCMQNIIREVGQGCLFCPFCGFREGVGFIQGHMRRWQQRYLMLLQHVGLHQLLAQGWPLVKYWWEFAEIYRSAQWWWQ